MINYLLKLAVKQGVGKAGMAIHLFKISIGFSGIKISEKIYNNHFIIKSNLKKQVEKYFSNR